MTSKLKTDILETVSGSGTIALTNQLSGMTSASLPSGSVLQVVNATYSTPVVNSTNTHVDTGLTATITPSATTSKILVMVNQNGIYKTAGSSVNSLGLKLLKGATDISVIATNAGYTATAIQNYNASLSTSYLDSPSTTSATTYKTQFASGNNTVSVSVQRGANESTITLMEIKG